MQREKEKIHFNEKDGSVAQRGGSINGGDRKINKKNIKGTTPS